ncbi:MAG TPA: hypothetical protein VLH09_06220 [Bryobacteraceae bacterium]|nr:hypothetical protein [Bryobacteraceae bacterium]
MRVPCSPEAFYKLSLAEQGFLPPDAEEAVTKVAEARQCSVEVVKLAQAYYEQMQKDGVPYEDPTIMVSDSFKLAEAYLEHQAVCAEEASALVSKLASTLIEAVSKFAEAEQLTELAPLALLKIAGLHAQEQLDVLAEIAELPPVKTAAEGAPPAFNMNDPKFNPAGGLDTRALLNHMVGMRSPEAIHPEAPPQLAKQVGADLLINAGATGAHDYHRVTTELAKNLHQHQDLNKAVEATRAANSGVRGFARNNKGALIGGGIAAGAGALALMHHLHQKSKAEKEIKQLEELVKQKESANVQRP